MAVLFPKRKTNILSSLVKVSIVIKCQQSLFERNNVIVHGEILGKKDRMNETYT